MSCAPHVRGGRFSPLFQTVPQGCVIAAQDDYEIRPSLWEDIAGVPVEDDAAGGSERLELIEELR